MTSSPLRSNRSFTLGPATITAPVVVTWGIVAALSFVRFRRDPPAVVQPSKAQTALEMLVDAVDEQIRGVMQRDPAPYRALIGTIFVFVLTANWCSLIPGVEPPTAHLETDAALAASCSRRRSGSACAARRRAAISRPSRSRHGL